MFEINAYISIYLIKGTAYNAFNYIIKKLKIFQNLQLIVLKQFNCRYSKLFIKQNN